MATRDRAKARKDKRKAGRLVVRAAARLEEMAAEMEAVRGRNDFWRTLLTASAFAAGQGNEMATTDVVGALHPELLR